VRFGTRVKQRTRCIGSQSAEQLRPMIRVWLSGIFLQWENSSRRGPITAGRSPPAKPRSLTKKPASEQGLDPQTVTACAAVDQRSDRIEAWIRS